MSGQPSQRVRRMASPSTKQGPMKAMKAFTLIQGSPISSPTSNLSSEPHRIKTHRRSPDSRSSPERRSPSSPSFKVERPKAARVSPASSSGLRRTGSLDTLRPIPLDTVGPYLTGQWPKDKTSVTSYHHYQAAGLLSCDKSTQTPDEWEISNNAEGKQKGHKRSSSLGNGDLKDFRQRLQRGSKQSELTKPRQSPVPGNHQALSATLPPFNGQSKAILIPTHISKATPSRPHPRNSVEGLNPEIENLTISSGEEPDEKISDNVFQQDGRRAPGPEMCRGSSTRSIDTQTPASSYVDEAATSSSGSRSHSVSPALPIIPGPMDTSRPSSIGDSLDNTARDAKRDDKGMENEVSPESPDVTSATKAASPMPNKSCSFVREPPDGCEKVKAIDEKERPRIKEPLFRPVKPNEFVLRPSAGSAFRPALKDTYSIMGLQPHSAHIAIKSPGVQTSSPQTSIESQ